MLITFCFFGLASCGPISEEGVITEIGENTIKMLDENTTIIIEKVQNIEVYKEVLQEAKTQKAKVEIDFISGGESQFFYKCNKDIIAIRYQ